MHAPTGHCQSWFGVVPSKFVLLIALLLQPVIAFQLIRWGVGTCSAFLLQDSEPEDGLDLDAVAQTKNLSNSAAMHKRNVRPRHRNKTRRVTAATGQMVSSFRTVLVLNWFQLVGSNGRNFTSSIDGHQIGLIRCVV